MSCFLRFGLVFCNGFEGHLVDSVHCNGLDASTGSYIVHQCNLLRPPPETRVGLLLFDVNMILSHISKIAVCPALEIKQHFI